MVFWLPTYDQYLAEFQGTDLLMWGIIFPVIALALWAMHIRGEI